MEIFIICLYSYLLGSVPFGLIYSKIAGLGDIRNIGSGNIGATNVLRTGNKQIAAYTLLSDIAKGSIAVLITNKFFSEYILTEDDLTFLPLPAFLSGAVTTPFILNLLSIKYSKQNLANSGVPKKTIEGKFSLLLNI